VAFCTQQAMAAHDTPGAAVAVAVDGSLAYETGFGVRRRKTSLPVDARTIFRIGSITKMMTAAGLLQLVETGAVHLDDPVTTYIPEFRLASPGAAETVTVEQLYLDTFVSDTDGDGRPDLDLTFIAPPGVPPLVRWMRNRLFVGTRNPISRIPTGRPLAHPAVHRPPTSLISPTARPLTPEDDRSRAGSQ